MKMVQAYIREERVPFVQKALSDIGVYGMTLRPVMGRGSQKGIALKFRGGILAVDLLPKVRLQIVVADDRVNSVMQSIRNSACTGTIGDGMIYVIPVEGSLRIRTKEVEV